MRDSKHSQTQTTNEHMKSMKSKKILRATSILLPGLLAVSAYGGFNNGNVTAQTAATGMSGVANTGTGYTEAKYSRSGVEINASRIIDGIDRSLGFVPVQNDTIDGVSLVVLTYWWSSITWSDGRCRVEDRDDGSHYAQGRVWD